MPRVAGRVVASMLAGVFLLVSVGAVVAAEDWPTYQGDNGRTGVRGEILDEAAVEVLWTFQTGSVNVHSTPAVVGGTVYFGAGDGGIYAVNATSGELVWVVETASRVRASPAVVDGVVYIGAEDGNVYALNSTNGDVVWTSEVGAGLRASPAVSNDTVVVVADNGTVIALDRANGTRKWSVPTEARSEAKPLIMDGMTYIPTVKAELFALDLQSGEIKWSVDEPWSFPRSVAGRTGTVFVQDPTGVVRAFNASSGDVLWRRDHDPGFLDNTPTVVGDAVYLTGLDTLFRLDATDGDRVWSTDLTRVGGVDSVSANSETVLGISSNGFVFAIDADTGETLWSRDVAGFVMTAPVVVDSVMYTGTRDWRLMAIQVAKNATNLPLDAPGHNNGTGATEDARLPGGKDASSVRSGIAVAVLGAAAIMARRDRNAPR